VLVPQADIELVRERLRRVRLKLAHRAEDDFTSVLVREVPMARDELPNAALGQSGGGTVATDPRDPQGRRALDRIFQFDVALPPELARVPFGTRVFVRFEHAPEPLGFQVWRRVRQTLLTRFGA
jgi:putative peptide zinc metalloprotease protein